MKDYKDFTNQQKDAITSLNQNISVAAGAGSGKTRVLVERFLYIVEEGKASADAILAITFTRKAAKEMRERVRNTLYTDLLAASKEKREFLEKQLYLLDKAQISTIDSFCSKVLRENPVEAGVDPQFQVREEYEIEEFKELTIEEFMKKAKEDGNKDLFMLLDNYGHRSVAFMLLELLPHLPVILACGDLKAPYTARIKNKTAIVATALKILEQLIAAKDQLGPSNQMAVTALEEQKIVIESGLANQQYDILQQLYKDSGLTARGKDKEIVNTFKIAADDLAMLQWDTIGLRVISAWNNILHQLSIYFRQKSEAEEYYSFDLIATKAIEVLTKYPFILEKYRKKYAYVMVDEFQDTNEVQKQLVYLLAGGNAEELKQHRLFVVGDAKQSIYRFRGADVSVFKTVRDAIDATGGKNIVMADNFRSSPEILAVCNTLFKNLLGTDKTKDVAAQDLKAHTKNSAKPMLITIEAEKPSSNDARKAEATLLAQHIKKLVECDEELSYNNVAILVPYINLAEGFALALKQVGIAYTIADGKGFYERQEIIDMVNLLGFLLNNKKDLLLAGILRSPYFGIDDDVLTRLFQDKGNLTLWEGLVAEAGNKQSEFNEEQQELIRVVAAKLKILMQCAEYEGLPELMEQIFSLLKVEPLLLGQEFGREKAANVQKLRTLAVNFAMEKAGTTADFLLRVQYLRDIEAREGAAQVQGSKDAVQIMTIHKSKGLEFPVVYLPALGSRGMGEKSNVRFISSIGLGIRVANAQGDLQETTVFKQVKAENDQLETSEKIRQLYVAMTRAEKYLFMSSIRKTKEKVPEPGKENWSDYLQRVFSMPENQQYVNVEKLTVQDISTIIPGSDALPVFTLPVATWQSIDKMQILPLAGNMFTASGLQTYDLCQKRYYYEQVLHMPEEEPEVFGQGLHKIKASVLGLIIHRVLELEQTLGKEQALSTALEEQQLSVEAAQTAAKKAKELLTGYYATQLYQTNVGIPREAEKNFTLSLFSVAGEAIYFKGSIDSLLHYQNGNLGIIDYKTGHPLTSGGAKQGYSRQLVIYALVAEKLFAKPVQTAQLHFLQDNSCWSLPKDRQALELELRNRVAEIRQKKSEQDFLALPTSCAYCPFNYFCKEAQL